MSETEENVPRQLIHAVKIGDEFNLTRLLEEFYKSTDTYTDTDTDESDKVDSVDRNENENPYNWKLSTVKDNYGNNLLHCAISHLNCSLSPCFHNINDDSPDGVVTLSSSMQRRQAQRRTHNQYDKSFRILELLLINPKYRIDPSLTNIYGETALHKFHSSLGNNPNLSSSGTTSRSKICGVYFHQAGVDLFFKHVLEEDGDNKNLINRPDSAGYTLLHNAVRQKCVHCLTKLRTFNELKLNINSGRSGKNHASFVTPQIFQYDREACSFLEQKLDAAIQYDDGMDENANNDDRKQSIHPQKETNSEEPKCGISLDFSGIVSHSAVSGSTHNVPEKEIEFIESFLEADSEVRQKILRHPLVQGFVYMKWKRIKIIYLGSFILHILLAFLYTAYILKLYLQECPFHNLFADMNNSSLGSWRKCDKKGTGFASSELAMSIILLVVGTILAFLEIIKNFHNWRRYHREWHNLFQVIMIISYFVSIIPTEGIYRWQYSVAAYGVFHVWATLMINVGRYPSLGIYIEMFGKVLQNFGYFMIVYGFLFVAFSIAFCVVFPQNFHNTFPTLVFELALKVITMMSGEVDYTEFFYGDKEKDKSPSDDMLHPITGHVLYGSFVVLITIVLTNLLVGLAVDNIKVLRRNAACTRTIREISNIAYVESIIFWKNVSGLKFLTWLKRKIVIAKFNLHRKHYWGVKYSRRGSNICGKKDPTNTSGSNGKKYYFTITPESCKKSEEFPEEIFENAMGILRKRHQAQFSHCKTCSCFRDYNANNRESQDSLR